MGGEPGSTGTRWRITPTRQAATGRRGRTATPAGSAREGAPGRCRTASTARKGKTFLTHTFC